MDNFKHVVLVLRESEFYVSPGFPPKEKILCESLNPGNHTTSVRVPALHKQKPPVTFNTHTV